MTPLVLVHGFMGGGAQWDAQAPLACCRDLIVVDLPGFGQNADMAPIDSISGYAAWVLAELSRRGVHRFDLLGHSMGGMIVQDMVRQAPDRVHHLILYGTGPVGVLPGRFETIETSMARARNDGAEATARRIAATWFLRGAADLAYAPCSDLAARAGLPAILAGLEAMRNWSGEAHLPHIASPTLVLWGDRDRTYAWPQIETLWTGIADTELAVVPGCAHAVHLESPGLFNRVLERYLTRTQ
ncbi:alpha/beta hydrolase [uncultured Tateyamaria sp.]|uniref:alpha/beta fold hydrolase n=1 Tax=Tateyamaria sp. 1078 TaxID=3417464 RepID=UPI0026113C6C|nr:alpha/beta hydrolase [uncultured Tateyamaria sp.]